MFWGEDGNLSAVGRQSCAGVKKERAIKSEGEKRDRRSGTRECTKETEKGSEGGKKETSLRVISTRRKGGFPRESHHSCPGRDLTSQYHWRKGAACLCGNKTKKNGGG